MKRLRVILLFLLLGAVVNVVVAICLGLVLPFVDSENGKVGEVRVISNFRTWCVEVSTSNGRAAVVSMWVSKSSSQGLYHTHSDGTTPEEVLPHWAMKYAHPVDNGCLRTTRFIGAYGWPKLALWSGIQSCSNSIATFKPLHMGSVTITNAYFPENVGIALAKDPTDLRRIPYGPIWTGLLLNTLFYAALFWLLITSSFALRRMFRRGRVLCVKCAYDLSGTDHTLCPECGAEVAKA